MSKPNLHHERLLVVGFGMTGKSVARYLARHLIQFDVLDQCDADVAASHQSFLESIIADTAQPQLHREFNNETLKPYSMLIISPGVPRSHPVIAAAIDRGVSVIGDIELFSHEVDVPVLAVTGSNGKSTVVAWLTHALRSAGVNAVACGNIGEPALDSLLEPAELYVLEMSSYQLESTQSLQSLAGAVLNVSEDHMDRYDGIEHYASVKRHLLDMSELKVVNFDDPRTWPVAGFQGRCEYFSVAEGDSAVPRWRLRQQDGVSCLCDGSQVLVNQDELFMPGLHNAANALAVIALAACCDVEFQQIRHGLVNFKGLPHRSQFVAEYAGVRWYNDSKGTNVDACKKAILAMPGPVLLIAGGQSKGADFTYLHDTVRRCVRVLILIGQDRDVMASQLAGKEQTLLADSLLEAVSIANNEAVAGDVVLLSPACASFDMFTNFEDRGEQFEAAVHEVLAA